MPRLPFTSHGERAGRAGGGLSAPELYNAGNAELRKQRFREAIDKYTQALSLDPTLAVAYQNRAVAHSEVGDKKASFLDLGSALIYDLDTDDYWEAVRRLGAYMFLVQIFESGSVPADQRERVLRRLTSTSPSRACS